MSWRICNNVSVFIGIIKKKLSFGGKYITCCISSNAQLCCLWSPKSYRIEKTERSSNPDLCPGEKASTLEKHHERHVGCRPAPEVNCELTMQSYIKGAMVKTYQNMGFMVYHPSHRNRYTGYITSSLVLDLWPSQITFDHSTHENASVFFSATKKLESSEGRQLQPKQNGAQARKQSEDRSSCCGIPKPPGLQRGNSYNNFEIVQDFENKVFFSFYSKKNVQTKEIQHDI